MSPRASARSRLLALLLGLLATAAAPGSQGSSTSSTSPSSKPTLADLQAALESTEGVPRVALLLNLAERPDAPLELVTECATEALELLGPDGDERLRARAWLRIGFSAEKRQRFADARAADQRALELAEAVGDRDLRTRALFAQGSLAVEQGEFARAFRLLNEALADAEERGDAGVAWRILNTLGVASRRVGSYQTAVDYYRKALRRNASTGDRSGYVTVANNLAFMLLELEQWESALELYCEALPVAEELGDPLRCFSIRAGIADAHLGLGEPATARELQRALLDELGHRVYPWMVGVARTLLAKAELALGELDAAAATIDESVAILGTVGTWGVRAELVRAQVLAARERREEALEVVRAVIAAAGDLRDTRLKARWQEAELLALLERPGEAYAAAVAAERLRREIELDQAPARIALVRANFQLEEAKRELARARAATLGSEVRAQNERLLRNAAIGGSALVLLCGYLVLRARLRRRLAEEERRNSERLWAHDRELAERLEHEVQQRSRELERQLEASRRLQEELHHKRRIEATGKLSGGIAHDFNNLLTVILQSIEVLQMRARLDERDDELLENAAEAARAGARITEQLLAFARKQTLKPARISLPEYFERVRPLLRGALRESITLEVEPPPADAVVEIDEASLTTALINLASNARDAISGQGSVRLAARRERVTEDDPVWPRLAPGPYLRLDFLDDGAGMAPEVARRACEPFFTTKSENPGNGLGLSMVLGFVQQSGGDLRLESGPRGGTTVTLMLPEVTSDPGSGVLQPATRGFGAAVRPRRCRVLLVEDNDLVREVTTSMLGSLGFEVTEARDADSARARFERGTLPELLITDVEMPGDHNGVDLARWVRANHPSVRILLVSGYAEPGDLVGWPLLGKPFGRRTLARALEELDDVPLAT